MLQTIRFAYLRRKLKGNAKMCKWCCLSVLKGWRTKVGLQKMQKGLSKLKENELRKSEVGVGWK